MSSAADSMRLRDELRLLLRRGARDRTTIMIAHRLTTLKDCDRILVFDEGQIVEAGSYHDLVQAHGAFAELASSASA